MRAIKVTYRAVFQQPIGKLNPMGVELPGDFAVEICGSPIAGWRAYSMEPRRLYEKLGRFASFDHAKTELAAAFRRQTRDWQLWGTPPGETQERMIQPEELADIDGKVFFKQAEDYTHIIHAQTIPPGARIPPAACGAQVNAECFISTKANVEPSCKGCAEVWRREYKGK
jgi:hypothetical protein